MQEFDPRTLPRSYYEARISALRKRLDDEQAAAKKTAAELEWWESGLTLFADDANEGEQEVVEFQPDPNGGARITSGANGEPLWEEAPGRVPTVREGILIVLSQHGASMKAGDLIDALEDRGWMPGGTYAHNTVRNKLRDLVKRKIVDKVAYGTYQLASSANGDGSHGEEVVP